MRQTTFRLANLLGCLVLMMLFSTVGLAQFRAGIQGSVSDSSGGLVSGATVVLTNKETGQTQQAETNDEGLYRFSNLAPALYSISVEKQGFKKTVIDEVKVEAESVRGQDIVLDAGGISETVTVQADNAGIQTEDPNVRRTISTQEVLRLPQVGRDPYELARLAPGVFGSGARGSNGGSIGLPNTTGPGGSNSSIFQTENQVPISANGQRLSANSFQIDGVSVNSQTWGGAAVVTPSQEAVKEVQVTSSTYSAEDGRNSGALIKVVSQNGTNDFHGSLFFKYADPSLNAFNKFGNGTRVENKFKQYGGSVGGPIVENKLFFFFTYEGARSRSNVPYDAWIETPQYRQAVINLRPGSTTAQIFQAPGIEPRIINVIPTTCAFANLDAARCHQVAGGLDLGSIGPGPSPTNPYIDGFGMSTGAGFDGVPDIQFARLGNPSKFSGNQYNTRIDFQPTEKDSFTVSTYFTPTENLTANPGGRTRPIADINSPRFNWAGTLIYNRAISSSMTNEFRFNMNGWRFDEIKANESSNFGIPRLEVEGLPFDRIRFGADRSEGTPGNYDESQFEFRDVFNWVIGNHILKIGGEWRKEINKNSIIGGARPLYSFVGLWNLANGAPIFEAINADPATGGPATGAREYSSNNFAFFLQDDWKVRPNLTVNLGLRWEYFSPLTDSSGQQSNLFLGPNGLVDAQVRPVDQLYESDWNNFGPQIGFAYSPSMFKDKMVIRGGFGLGYNRLPNTIFLNARGNPPGLARFGICCGHTGEPFANGRITYVLGSSNSPDSYPINPALGQGINPATGAPVCCDVEIYGSPQELPTSYVRRYSLDMEYELPLKLIGTVGYQGSAGSNFVRLVNQNFVFAQTNPAFFATYFAQPDVTTNYNGMNARLRRRFTNGFQFDVLYRWSKSLDQLSYEGPGFVTNQTFPVDNSTENGPSDYDVRHAWVFSGLWDIPNPIKGNSWAAKLVGGWQINGIYTYHTGFPWTPKIGSSVRSLSGAFFGPIRPIAFLGGQPRSNSNDNLLTGGLFPDIGPVFTVPGTCIRRNNYFIVSVNPIATNPPDCNNAGTPTYLVNPPGIGRNVFRGPKYRALDISLVKRFRLGGLGGWLEEGAGVDLRANFFNIFNQLNLDNFQFGDDSTFVDRAQFGKAQRALAGRTVELQVRFNF
jgi:hypothetical protein